MASEDGGAQSLKPKELQHGSSLPSSSSQLLVRVSISSELREPRDSDHWLAFTPCIRLALVDITSMMSTPCTSNGQLNSAKWLSTMLEFSSAHLEATFNPDRAKHQSLLSVDTSWF